MRSQLWPQAAITRIIRIGLALTVTGLLSTLRAGAEEETLGAKTALTIVGSGYTMPAIMDEWVDAFMRERKSTVRFVGSGTSTGPPALIEGTAQLAAMSRSLRAVEAETLRSHFGQPPIEIPVAVDTVAVFVHQDNPLRALTIPQVDAIFSDARRCGHPSPISYWSEVGLRGPFEGRRIALFGRRAGSGTGSYFRSTALCGGRFRDWIRVSPGRESAARHVAESRFGIGFGSLRDQRPGMRALRLAAGTDSPSIDPNPNATSAADYPLRRTLNLVAVQRGARPLDDSVLEFLRFVLRESSQRSVRQAGYEPLPPPLLSKTRRRVEQLVGR